MDLQGKKILVTGAGGYVGGRLADAARREGACVRLLIRNIESHMSKWLKDFEVVQEDITQSHEVSQAMAGCEFVWHCASANETVCNVDPHRALQINVAGTMNLLDAAAAAGIRRFIKFSTFHVYGAADAEVITEDTPARPKAMYGLTNLMGDEAALYYARQKKLSVAIPRLSNGYGAPLFREIKRWTLVINELCRMAHEKGEIALKSSGLAERDFVALEDVYDAVKRLTMSESLPDTVFNVGGGSSSSIMDIARRVQSVYQARTGKLVKISKVDPAQGERPAPIRYDVSRMRELGYSPQDRMNTAMACIFDLLERQQAAA